MSGKDFGENQKFRIAARGSFLIKIMTILPVDHKVGPIVIFPVKITRVPLHHHGDYIMSLIVFILSEHVAKYDKMPCG